MTLPKWTLLALLCAVGLQAAPVNYEKTTYTYNVFKKRTGKWDSAANWGMRNVPTPDQEAVITDNSEVELSRKVSSISAMLLGGKGPSSLTIKEGGVLELDRHLSIGKAQDNTAGTLSLEGGYLRTDLSDKGNFLHVGRTYSNSSKGFAFFRSGTYAGGIQIGNTLKDTGVGTLSIIGSQVKAGAKSTKDSFRMTAFGTLVFELDAEGVSTLDYKNNSATFDKDARIIIDGSKYAGKSKVFVLLASGRVRDQGAIIECINFPERYTAKAAIEKRGIVLTVREK